jgi:hypothetical protein
VIAMNLVEGASSAPPSTTKPVEPERTGNMGEWESYIVSGHRAPSVALPQYRRMGGRYF